MPILLIFYPSSSKMLMQQHVANPVISGRNGEQIEGGREYKNKGTKKY
jgi:hypothetical protein